VNTPDGRRVRVAGLVVTWDKAADEALWRVPEMKASKG
jgi:hypothetical protein